MLTTVPEMTALMACVPSGSGSSSGDGLVPMSRLPCVRIASGSTGSTLAAGAARARGFAVQTRMLAGRAQRGEIVLDESRMPAPARQNQDEESRLRRNSRLLDTPEIRNSDNARRAFAVTVLKSPGATCTMTFASSESKRGLTRKPAWPQVSTRTPGPAGGSKASSTPPAGTDNAVGRHGFRVDTHLHRHAAR